MGTELLILRHAKSSWDSGAATDYERPLSPRGLRTAPRVGRWIAEHDLIPDFAFVSPAQRTRQTMGLLVDAMGSEPETRFEERIYEASLGELLTLLSERPAGAARVLILGHNPGLAMLADYLAAEGLPIPPDGKAFPTAALAHLALPDDWSDLQRGDGRLQQVLRPRELKD